MVIYGHILRIYGHIWTMYGHRADLHKTKFTVDKTHERLPKRSMKAGRLSRTFGPNHCEKYGGTIRRAQNQYEKYGEKIGMLPNHYKSHQNIGLKFGIWSKSHKT